MIILIFLGFSSLIRYVRINEEINYATVEYLLNNHTDCYNSYAMQRNNEVTNNNANYDNYDKYTNFNYVKECYQIRKALKNVNEVSGQFIEGLPLDDYVIYDFGFIYNSIFNLLFTNTISYKGRYKIRNLSYGESITGYGLVNERCSVGKDVWQLSNLERGKFISSYLGNNLGYDETGMDAVENDTLISIISLDFRKVSYLDDDAVYRTIIENVNYLSKFNREIKDKKYSRKMLHLVIPEYPNEFVERQICMAKKVCMSKNTIFKITVMES